MGNRRRLPLHTHELEYGYAHASYNPDRDRLQRFATSPDTMGTAGLIATVVFLAVLFATPGALIATTGGQGGVLAAAAAAAALIVVGTGTTRVVIRQHLTLAEHVHTIEYLDERDGPAAAELLRLLESRSEIVKLARTPGGTVIDDDAIVALERITFAAFGAVVRSRSASADANLVTGNGAGAEAHRERRIAAADAEAALCRRYADLVGDMSDAASELYASFADLGDSEIAELFDAETTDWAAIDAISAHTVRMRTLAEAAAELSADGRTRRAVTAAAQPLELS